MPTLSAEPATYRIVDRQKVEAVPAFADLAVDDASDGHTFEFDTLPGSVHSELAARMRARDVAVHRDHFAFGDNASGARQSRVHLTAAGLSRAAQQIEQGVREN